jgi:hypothetical protein
MGVTMFFILGGVGQPGSIAITPLFYIFDNRRNKAAPVGDDVYGDDPTAIEF